MSIQKSGWTISWFVLLMGSGCGGHGSTDVPLASPAAAKSSDTQTSAEVPAKKARRSGPVVLENAANPKKNSEAHGSSESVVVALQPLQVLLGRWNATSRQAKVDQPEWVWDFQSNRDQPALVMSSADGAYLRDARLTFLVLEQTFQLSTVDADGLQRLYQGNFREPVRDEPGDDQQLQRTFKLELTEVNPATDGERWRLTLAQQENNRYLLELNRQRGAGTFQRVDTIHTQRDGTSFAFTASDYGEKTCIISQGLGTIAVSYEGRSFWVCCTGCKAAFEEDPERWIARFDAMKSNSR